MRIPSISVWKTSVNHFLNYLHPMSSITDLIRKEIESLSTDPTKTNVGTITALADGVAKVEGLSKVMFNEMVEFPNNVFGIALNLEEDELYASDIS